MFIEVYKKCIQLNSYFLANFWKNLKNLKKQFFLRFGNQKVPSMMDLQKICYEAISLAR